VYLNFFNRAPDAEGKAYWLEVMDKGWVSIANAAYAVLGGAQNEDARIIDNKVAAASYFTQSLNTAEKQEAYNEAGNNGVGGEAKSGAIQSGGNKQSIAACLSLAPDTSGERVPRQGWERGQRGGLSGFQSYRRFRAAWNDALSWPCRATLPRQAWEGTASGSASPGKVFPPL
jgi:hypothetical protein